jgi:hypothetical protein
MVHDDRLLPTKWQRNLIRTLLVLFTFGPSLYHTHYINESFQNPPTKVNSSIHPPHHKPPPSVVASTVHNFGVITGFVGAITDTLQGFVLPPLIFAAAYKATLPSPERAALVAMSALGALIDT